MIDDYLFFLQFHSYESLFSMDLHQDCCFLLCEALIRQGSCLELLLHHFCLKASRLLHYRQLKLLNRRRLLLLFFRLVNLMKQILISPTHKQCWKDSCPICPSWRMMSTSHYLISSTVFQTLQVIPLPKS